MSVFLTIIFWYLAISYFICIGFWLKCIYDSKGKINKPDIVIVLLAPVFVYMILFTLYMEMEEKKEKKKQDSEPKEEKRKMRYSGIGFKDLPFVPKHEQVIYVESSYNDEINSLIKENHELICGLFHHYDMEFVYLPIETSREIMAKRVGIEKGNADNATYPEALKSDYMLDFMARPENRMKIPACLMWFEEYDDDTEEAVFQMFRFPEGISEFEDLKQLAYDVSYKLYDYGSILFRVKEEELSDEEYAAQQAKLESKLKEELEAFKNSAERLSSSGITQMMLHRILAEIVPVSPLVITPDYRIVLPGFDNKEVELTHLQKTLYFFFLRYPEGVILKHMQEHNVELYNIYAQLNTSAKEEKMRQTIKDLTNPLNNRLHENIARIKSAFLKVMDQYTAQKYIVDGAKGEPYRITLDRELVEWQE